LPAILCDLETEQIVTQSSFMAVRPQQFVSEFSAEGHLEQCGFKVPLTA
jgi:hypothetical protein